MVKYTEEQLVDILAKTMSYGGSLFEDDVRNYNGGNNAFRLAMETVSMTVACWLAAYTLLGEGGIDWDVVYTNLIESSINDKEEKFIELARKVIKEYGGVK